jgi:polyphosphate kinase
MPDGWSLRQGRPRRRDAIISERGWLGMPTCRDRRGGPARPQIPAVRSALPERIREHGGDCFAAIREKDILVHHPYESFEVVVEFLRRRRRIPTSSRSSRPSTAPASSRRSSGADRRSRGRQVRHRRGRAEGALRRGAEHLWANALERAGVQVVYGFVDWKTHAKVSMVVRREAKGYRTYCHFGTGNYHPVTARIYTDVSYFTAEPRLGRDARSCSTTSPAT